MESKMPKGNLYIVRKSDNTVIKSGISTLKAAQKLIATDAETSKTNSYIVLSPKLEVEVSSQVTSATVETEPVQAEAVESTTPAKPKRPKFFK